MNDNFDAVVEDTRNTMNDRFSEAVDDVVEEAAIAVAALLDDPVEPKKFLGAARSLWYSSGAAAAVSAAIATFAPGLGGLLP